MMKTYMYKVGGAVIIAAVSQLTIMRGPGIFEAQAGVSLDTILNSPGLATRKPKKKAKKTPKTREVKASCHKCGRVFFRPQGVHQHIKHCKGEKKEGK